VSNDRYHVSPARLSRGVNPNPEAVNAAQNVLLEKTNKGGRRCSDDGGTRSTHQNREEKGYAAILGHKANAEAKKRVINPLHSPWKDPNLLKRPALYILCNGVKWGGCAGSDGTSRNSL
jgi:hypothetical protein